jgi:integrase
LRAHTRPKLYLRHGVFWCYWRNERWSTRTADRRAAERAVRLRYDPPSAPAVERTVDDAILLLYRALERRGRSEATKDAARDKLAHFAALWEGRVLTSLDWPAVAEYIRIRLEDDGVSRVTVSGELGYLRQAWKLSRAEGWCSRAWDELLPERFDRHYVPRTRWLTPRELTAVLSSLELERAAVVAWIVATGSDVGDLARAQAGDLDWKRGLVRVRGTKTVFRDRYVPITSLTRPLLKLAAPQGPPFAAWPWINGALRRLARIVGIEHFSPKDLRRTHGQWLRSAGVEPHLIGRVLGHADSAMADRVYAQGEDLAIARLVRGGIRKPRNIRTRLVRVAH